MFDNIGGKIKTLATVTTVIGIVASVISGFVTVIAGIDEGGGIFALFGGVLVIALGSVASWVSSFVLYGFGQLVENSDFLVEKAYENKSTSSNSNYYNGGGSSDHGWICKKCNTRNVSLANYCKECGTYK